MLKNKISKNLKNKKIEFKALSTPNFTYTNQNFIFNTQKNNLESLTNLIKVNQLNYFSNTNIENDFIIRFLKNLKESLLISFKTQNLYKEEILKYNDFSVNEKNYSATTSDNLEFEIEQLKNLNFISENEIKKIDSFIKRKRDKIKELKKIELIQEDKKDILLTSNKDINNIETELNIKLFELRQKLDELKFIEQQDQTELNFLSKSIKKYNDIFYNEKYDKKYIDTEQVIEEEEHSKSCNRTNSLNRIYNKTQENINHYDFDKNIFNSSLSNKKRKLENNYEIINLKQNFNLNINFNFNLTNNNYKEDKNQTDVQISDDFVRSLPNLDFNHLKYKKKTNLKYHQN